MGEPMGNVEQLSEHKQADRQRALLALASEEHKAKKPMDCPSPEEIACLVEGRIKGATKQRLLAHLGNCEHCYRQWRDLDLHLHQQDGKLVPFWQKKRYVTYIGSALAAAASVALFLNITTSTRYHKQIFHLPAETADTSIVKPDSSPAETLESPPGLDFAARQAQPPVEPYPTAGEEGEKGGEIAAPKASAPQGADQKTPASEVILLEPVPQNLPRKAQTRSAPMLEKSSSTVQTAGRQKTKSEEPATIGMGTSKIGQAGPLDDFFDLKGWLDRLQDGCKQKQSSDFWRLQLQQSLKKSDLSQNYPEIINILEHLGQGEQVESNCKQLLQLIKGARAE
jgi:hypothetical protein